MSTILVVANETLAGAKLLKAVKRKARKDARLVLCVPRKNPKHGNVVYDDSVFDAAKVRIDLARRFMRAEGFDVIGEVGDPDPYTATIDAVAEYAPDEIIVSTFPTQASGWMRRDLIERIEGATRLPVTHIEQDIDAEGLPFDITLVVAARTASGNELLKHLKAKAAGARQSAFIVVVPQQGAEGSAAARARSQMAQVVDRLVAAKLLAAGMIGDPDPYTATVNAVETFRVDDIVISTLPSTRSGWLRADLVERVRKATGLQVEHVEAAEPVAKKAAV